MPDNGQTWCGCRADNSQLDGDYMCKLYKPEAGWGLYEDEEGWELCKELEGLQLAFQLGIPHVGWRLPGCGPSMTPRTRAGSRSLGRGAADQIAGVPS